MDDYCGQWKETDVTKKPLLYTVNVLLHKQYALIAAITATNPALFRRLIK